MFDFKGYRCRSSPHRGLSLAELLAARSVRDEATGCLVWQGAQTSNGEWMVRGIIIAGGRWLAHRVAWEVHRGPLPDGKRIGHSCKNGLCVEPSHLVLTDPSAAMKGAWEKGSFSHLSARNRKLDDRAVSTIVRALAKRGRKGKMRVYAEMAERFGVCTFTIMKAAKRAS